MILHTKKRSAHEFTLGMPPKRSQIQMSIKGFEGEATMADPKASQRFFITSLSSVFQLNLLRAFTA